MSIHKFFQSNKVMSSVMGLGLGSSTLIGACGGLCGASVFPLGAFLASVGLGSVAIFLVKLRLPLLVLAAIFGVVWIRNLMNRKQKIPAVIIGIALGFGVAYSVVQVFYPLGLFSNSQTAKVDEIKIENLREKFNKFSGKTRIISLMSPGCDVCQRAFNKTIKEAFLRFPSEDLVGFNIWLPWVWGDSKDLAGVLAANLSDNRVENYWDERAEVSSVLTKTLQAKMDVWDIYLVYAPGVVWSQDLLPMPTFFMHQLPEKYGLDMNLHLNTEIFFSRLKDISENLGYVHLFEQINSQTRDKVIVKSKVTLID